MTIPGPEEALSTRLRDDQAAPLPIPRGCPFLLAAGGGWRLDVATKDHQCAAVSPAAALSLEKQARLCLTAAHTSCATYLASMEARGTRLGTPTLATAAVDQATRWRLTRTTAVIEDAGGVRSRVVAALTDRRRWPAVPAVLLLTGLIVLGFSGLRGTPASAVASPTPSQPAVTPTPAPPTTPRPTGTPVTTEPSIAPSAPPTVVPTGSVGPGETFRIYTVKSGDTLSVIASRFGTTSRAIADLNGIKVSTTLHIGQKLKIPNT